MTTARASAAQNFLLANQLQRLIREGQPQAAKRVVMLESLLQLEREEAEREAAGAGSPPSPAPMAETPSGIKLQTR